MRSYWSGRRTGAVVQRKLRFRNREDFSRIYRMANRLRMVNSSSIGLEQMKAEPFRLGVSASKKIGNAVVATGCAG